LELKGEKRAGRLEVGYFEFIVDPLGVVREEEKEELGSGTETAPQGLRVQLMS
jgi:hypothetical protein